MNPYASPDSLLRSEAPSMTKAAIYHRVRRLTNDAFSDSVAASNKKSRNKRRQKNLTRRNEFHSYPIIHSKALEDRIRLHLSRGRDIADIVIREGIKSSVIQSIIAKITAATNNAT